MSDAERHDWLARTIYDEWRSDCPGEPAWSRLRGTERDRWIAIAAVARGVWADDLDGRAQSFLDAVWRANRARGKQTFTIRRVAGG